MLSTGVGGDDREKRDNRKREKKRKEREKRNKKSNFYSLFLLMMKQGDESSPCTTERDHEYIYIYIMLCELQKSAPSVFAHYGHPP